MKRRLAGALLPLPLLLVLVLALAGCGGSDDDDVATAGGEATEGPAQDGGGTEPLSEEEIYEAQLAFAECMREHGVDIEDPQPGEGLRIQVQGDPAVLQAAQQACQDLLPQGGPGQGGGPNPQAQEQMLAMAECMRDNGVESFPDPQPGGGIQIGAEVAEDPDFAAAREKCGEEILGGQPETSGNGGGA